ncbi:MAG: hypothetical protein IPF92_24235 [Myxococcales bacterium]|nr:hypothetical protein [Myxococcales bacterium]MBL0193447.1 hypothetical protein [Myxococcales bacterium]
MPRLTRSLVLLSVAALGACKDPPAAPADAAPPPPSSASAAPEASAPIEAPPVDAGATEGGALLDTPSRPMVRGAGHFSLLFAAARALEMKDEQRDKLDAVAKPFLGLPEPKEGARAVQAELVREVKAGKMEPGKLDPLLASLEKGTKQRRDLEQSGLDALHAALDPAQHKAIVAAIRPRIAVHDAAKAPAPDPTADARVVERLAKSLSLDDAQRKQAEAFFPKGMQQKAEADRDERRKQLETLLAAFEKPTFSARRLPAPDAKRLRVPFQEQVKLLSQLVPILRPEQHARLAESMSQGQGGGLLAGPHGLEGPNVPHGMPLRRRPHGGGRPDEL